MLNGFLGVLKGMVVTMKRILVVEDEAAIREFVVINLKRAGYETTEADCGERALEILEHDGDYQVILLDIMMPGIDGLSVCKQVRAQNSKIGIIMLSAKTQEMDKVSALMMGADDYMTKPFSPSELVARVDSLNRRVEMLSNKAPGASDKMILGEFTLDLRRRILQKNGKAIELTPVEFQITEYLFSNPDVPLDRTDILKRVWGDSYIGEEKIVDVNIRRLRMKVEDDPSVPRHLLTVWGRGYKWVE